MTTLAIRNLSAWYGQARALWDVALEVQPGEVVAVLGRNGAGKTTLLSSLSGLQKRTKGEITFDECRIDGLRADAIAIAGLTFIREGAQLPASLTVTQNLQLGQRLARLRGAPPTDLEEAFRYFPLLDPFRSRKAGLLSGGQRQALALATAFISSPKVLLMDEPSAGLAPQIARDVFAAVKQFAARGIGVLVVEQHPAWLIGIAQRAYLLELGKIGPSQPLTQLLEHPEQIDLVRT